jgi:hypothetical protein
LRPVPPTADVVGDVVAAEEARAGWRANSPCATSRRATRRQSAQASARPFLIADALGSGTSALAL